MATDKLGTQEEWAAARAELQVREEEHARLGDELARQRRELPWVPVEPLTADGLPLHVRALVERSLPGVFVDRRHARSPGSIYAAQARDDHD